MKLLLDRPGVIGLFSWIGTYCGPPPAGSWNTRPFNLHLSAYNKTAAVRAETLSAGLRERHSPPLDHTPTLFSLGWILTFPDDAFFCHFTCRDGRKMTALVICSITEKLSVHWSENQCSTLFQSPLFKSSHPTYTSSFPSPMSIITFIS